MKDENEMKKQKTHTPQRRRHLPKVHSAENQITLGAPEAFASQMRENL